MRNSAATSNRWPVWLPLPVQVTVVRAKLPRHAGGSRSHRLRRVGPLNCHPSWVYLCLDLGPRAHGRTTMASDFDPTKAIPADDSTEDLPAVIPQGGEVVVAVQPEGLLVGGDPAEVDAYVERIQRFAPDTRSMSSESIRPCSATRPAWRQARRRSSGNRQVRATSSRKCQGDSEGQAHPRHRRLLPHDDPRCRTRSSSANSSGSRPMSTPRG